MESLEGLEGGKNLVLDIVTIQAYTCMMAVTL